MTESDSRVLLTTDDLKGMDDELARVEEDIVSLESQLSNKLTSRDKILAQRSKVYELLAALGKIVPNIDLPQTRTVQKDIEDKRTIHASRAGNSDVGGVTWMSEISRILSDHADGVTYEDLRAGIDQGPLAERLRQSDKGLYGGVAKLEVRGALIKHNGRLFNPPHHADFIQRVAAGVAEDILPSSHSTRPSPMADAILSLLQGRPSGIEGGEIVDGLKLNPQFSEVVSKNNTSAYNVLKRMLDRNQIRKDGRTYFLMSNDSVAGNNSGAGDDRS